MHKGTSRFSLKYIQLKDLWKAKEIGAKKYIHYKIFRIQTVVLSLNFLVAALTNMGILGKAHFPEFLQEKYTKTA